MLNKNKEGYLISLAQELIKNSSETEWLEFKLNNIKPDDIGERVSALANSAALHNKSCGYMIWGVDDKTHEVMGTSFNPSTNKVGNEELESWLLRLIDPEINLEFYTIKLNDKPIVIAIVPKASRLPVFFKKEAYIRIGSYTKKLKDYPEKEKRSWRHLENYDFEIELAVMNATSDQVLELLDFSSYYTLQNLPIPKNNETILKNLANDNIICTNDNNNWDVTNLGALLFANKLSEFKSLRRKNIRIIKYKNSSRLETLTEPTMDKGYANGFDAIFNTIYDLIKHEVIEDAFRKQQPIFPLLAIRELVANALIHQDFNIKGTGPMVEIFDNRIEITNPGIPLIEMDRLLDSPPRSRNEMLASFMRRAGICEERGSGIDKVVNQTELYHLPAPIFETIGDSTRTVLFSYQPLNKMEKNDKIRACYLHASLKYVTRDFMTNSSLRERLQIDDKNSAIASRIIKETLEAGLVVPYDETTSKKHSNTHPFGPNKFKSYLTVI